MQNSQFGAFIFSTDLTIKLQAKSSTLMITDIDVKALTTAVTGLRNQAIDKA